MRIALHKLFALAALAALALGAPALAAKAEGEHKEGEHKTEAAKPTLYVKDGDHYRAAKPDELPAAGAGHDSHKGGGLDFTGIHRYDLGIYTLIVFGILMLVLSKYAWPNIKAGLEKREVNIRSALDQARKDRADSEARLAEARKQLADAAQQAAAVLADARKDAEALKAAETEKGVKDAQIERDRATRDMEAKMEALKKELTQQMIEVAALMASKALRKQVTLENQRELLDESIAELKVNANKA
jgi:F-type H+-transporting ATPase subunit b